MSAPRKRSAIADLAQPDGRDRRPRDRARRSAVLAGSTPRRCPDISKLAALGYKPRVPLDEGLPPTLDWYWEHEARWRRRRDAGREGDCMSPFPQKVARAAGTGASVPVECCQVCGHAPLETVLSLGYMPPVNQMVPIGAGAAAAAVVSDQSPALRASAIWCSSASRSIRSSSSRRNIPTPAARPSCCATISPISTPKSSRNAQARAAGPRHRHRLERRHAALELQEGRPPRARHRADRRQQDRRRAAASRRSSATSRRRRRREVQARARRRRASSRRPTASRISRTCTPSSTASSSCSSPTACSSPNRTISSGCSTRCNTTPSITSTCATIRSPA